MAKRTVEVLLKAKDQTKQATDSAGKGFKSLQKTLVENSTLIAGFGAAAVAAMGAAATAVYKFLDATSTMEDALAKAAKRAQVDIRTYGEWAHVLQLAGASAGNLEKSIAAMSRQMLNAERGSLESVEAFEALGINVKDANDNLRDSGQVFEEVINNLSDMEDKTKRAALAQVLMGRGGKMLIPVLDQTRDQIKQQREEWGRLGGDAIVAAAETGEAWVDAQLRVQTAQDGVRASLLSAFGPEIVTLINGVAVSIAALADESERLEDSVGFPSLDAFVSDMEAFATVAPASVKLMKEMAETAFLLESRNFTQVPQQLLEVTDAINDLQAASVRASLARRGISLDFPGGDEGVVQLKEYSDLLKISRQELEQLAEARGVAVTGQRQDLPGADIARTSEAIAKDIVESYKKAVDKAGPDVRAALEKLAAEYDISTTEKVIDLKTGSFIDQEKTSEQLAKEITSAAAKAVDKAAPEIAKEVERLAALTQTELLALSESFGVDLYETVWDPVFQQMIDVPRAASAIQKDLEEAVRKASEDADFVGPIAGSITEIETNLDSAAIAANGFAQGMGQILIDSPFKVMTGQAVDFAKVMQTTVIGVLQSVLKQLLVIRAVGFFGSAFGLKDGGTVPGNLGQIGPGLKHGGNIPRAAYGYSVPDGIRGQDSRLIYAMPGEEVINRELSQRLNRFITVQESAAYASPYGSGSRSGGGGTVLLNVGIPDSMAGLQRMQDGIVESLSGGGVA